MIQILRKTITVEIFLAIYYILMLIDEEIIIHISEEYFADKSNPALEMLHTIGAGVISVFLSLCLGSHSDTQKLRKPFLLFPVFGLLLKNLGYLLCVYLKHSCSSKVKIILTYIPALCGGEAEVTLLSLAYICDITNETNRTFRLGMVYLAIYCSVFFVEASRLFGDFSQFTVYQWLFGSLNSIIFMLLYGLFWLKESRNGGVYTKSIFTNAANPRHLIDTLKVLGNNTILVMMMLWIMFAYSSAIGIHLLVIFFIQKHDLGYIFYQLYFSVSLSRVFGTLMVSLLFFKNWEFKEVQILVIAVFGNAIANLTLAQTKSMALKFTACFFGMTTMFCPIAITSIKSKMTSDTNYAKVLALCSLFERLGFRLAHLYGYLFETQLPYNYMSSVLYFGAIMHVTCIPAALYIYTKSKKVIVRHNVQIEHENHM